MTPQDRQRSTTRGVEDINWGVEPLDPPGNSHTCQVYYVAFHYDRLRYALNTAVFP